MLTIAHLSDVHLPPIAGFTPRHWSVKRALGYVNWLRERRPYFDRAVLERIVADIRAANPDHIAVTGDLVNIGLPKEHINALAWLERLGPPQRVSVVPGNHDIYQRLWSDPGIARWTRYMSSEGASHGLCDGASPARASDGGVADRGPPPSEEPRFPFLRRIGPLAVIGVNSAVPTLPLIASGRVGPAQRARLAALLEALGREGVFRLVLIHHPPLPGQATRFRGLEDAPQIAELLVACGAELVIHGHNHDSTLAWCGSGSRRVPVVGVPAAALARARGNTPLARHNLYRIKGPPWQIELIGRGLAEPDGGIVEIERRQLLAEP
jgi:3',5'-cyclic AMP phosphodiesterase CpdA